MSAAKTVPPPTVTMEDIMVTHVYRVTPDMKLQQVAELFIKYRISGAPIVDVNDHVISIIGEGDTLRLAATQGLEATVAHCLNQLPKPTDLITLQKHNTFTDAYRLFLKHKFHRICIVDSMGLLKGLVSRATIMQVFVEAHYGKKLPPRPRPA